MIGRRLVSSSALRLNVNSRDLHNIFRVSSFANFSPIPTSSEKLPKFIPRNFVSAPCALSRHLSTSASRFGDDKPAEKVGIAKKFKQLFKDYWYVLIPVHVATSIVWYGGFYVLCKSGIDMAEVLSYMGASDAYLEKVKSSDLGYFALAYACYKVATPARYTVTVGGTTMSIKYLKDRGYLRTSEDLGAELKDRGKEVRENIKEKRAELKENIIEKRAELQSRKDAFKDEWTQSWEKFAKKKK